MPNLTDLAPEVLAMCASYLAPPDLKNLMLVSKQFNMNLQSEMYRNICLPWKSYNKQVKPGYIATWRERDILTHAKYPHNLATRLLKRPNLAMKVRSLWIEIEACKMCKRAQGHNNFHAGEHCTQLRKLFSNLVGLKHLGLHDWKAYHSRDNFSHLVECLKLVSPAVKQKLLSLHIVDQVCAEAYDGRGTLDVLILQDLLTSSSIKRLHLQHVHLARMAGVMALPSMAGLRTLILHDCSISPTTLLSLSKSATELHTFGYTDDIYASDCHDTSLAALAESIEPWAKTLIELRLLHSNKTSDKTTIKSLTFMTALKRISINPANLLGRQHCDIDRPCPGPGELMEIIQFSQLSQKLPTGLEEIKLIVDHDQSRRIKDYKKSLVKSIVDNKARFPHLRAITLVENTATDGRRCSTGKCYPRMRANNARGLASVKTEFEPGQPWRKCKELDISLKFERVHESKRGRGLGFE